MGIVLCWSACKMGSVINLDAYGLAREMPTYFQEHFFERCHGNTIALDPQHSGATFT